MPTKQEIYECYACEKETSQGIFRDLPYDEYVGQVFICNDCLQEEAKLMEGRGEEYDLQ